jgi:hypothetical protein
VQHCAGPGAGVEGFDDGAHPDWDSRLPPLWLSRPVPLHSRKGCAGGSVISKSFRIAVKARTWHLVYDVIFPRSPRPPMLKTSAGGPRMAATSRMRIAGHRVRNWQLDAAAAQ